MKTFIRVTMPDGSVWEIPVATIAKHRARNYAHEYGGSVERSLAEDTLPLFRADSASIRIWARNNMNWSDVSGVAVCVENAPAPDLQEGWVNGPMVLV